jgi:hypothetical protein
MEIKNKLGPASELVTREGISEGHYTLTASREHLCLLPMELALV